MFKARLLVPGKSAGIRHDAVIGRATAELGPAHKGFHLNPPQKTSFIFATLSRRPSTLGIERKLSSIVSINDYRQWPSSTKFSRSRYTRRFPHSTMWLLNAAVQLGYNDLDTDNTLLSKFHSQGEPSRFIVAPPHSTCSVWHNQEALRHNSGLP